MAALQSEGRSNIGRGFTRINADMKKGKSSSGKLKLCPKSFVTVASALPKLTSLTTFEAKLNTYEQN